jgi:shikimate dehydrogenase
MNMTDEASLVNGSTRLYGIVGHPIAQVRSPEVMTARLQQAGHNAVLVAMHVLPDRFTETLRGIMQLQNLDGLIFTVPYKVRATELATTLLPNAQRVGGINALRREANGSWSGDIFDGIGLVRGLAAQGFDVAGSRVKMLGAGGAGSAVAVALAEAGVAALAISDVDPGRAELLARRIAGHFPGCKVESTTDAAKVGDCTLLINCSPVGMKAGEGMPAPFGRFDPNLMVVDVIMKPAVTPLAEHARACGCRVMNGVPMLDNQAQAVLEFFTGAQA